MMNHTRQYLYITLTALIVCCSFNTSAQTGGTSINTVKIDVMVDNTTYVAIEAAGVAAGVAVVSGEIYKVPITVLKAVATHVAYLRLGKFLNCKHICTQFQIWAHSHAKTPPFSSGDEKAFDVEVNLVDSDGKLLGVITVPYFAKAEKSSGGKISGYAAPMGTNGASMKLDVFGDRSLILERMECPCK
ncbi:MAG: hypothetical protein IPM69_06790 [Ignavibacteria bacterium]|nr:hypothetical protein [Ignavibacteria bacterium]